MKTNNSQKRRKKIGGLLPSLLHFVLVLAAEAAAVYLIFRSGVIRDGSFLFLASGLASLLLLKLLMKPFAFRNGEAIVATMYFLALHSVTVVLPVIIFTVSRTIALARSGLELNPFFTAFSRIILLAIFSGLFEENLRKVFVNTVYAKYHVQRCSFLWIMPLSALVSMAAQLAGCRLLFHQLPDLPTLVFMGILEVYLAVFYQRGSIASTDKMDAAASSLNRIFLTVLICSPLCLFRNAGLSSIRMPSGIVYLSAAAAAILVIYAIAKRKELDAVCYDVLMTWGIPHERLYTQQDHAKKKTIFWRTDEDVNLFTYVILSLAVITLVLAVHFILHFMGLVSASCSLPFVRENGLSLITTLISSTFLIVSFLSFLGDRDDKVLWTDMRSYCLINPPVFNFIGLSVFAFASLAATALCFLFRYDILFFIAFLAGMFFLTYLTFLVIVSYFRRKETIDRLSEYAVSTLFDPEDDFGTWQIISDELYENAARMIEDKNWSKLQEVYDHLIAMYNGIRKAQIRELLMRNDFHTEVRIDDLYTDSFRSFIRRFDVRTNPLFTIMETGNPEFPEEFALFDSRIILEELNRLLSLLDYRTLKLLINRNKPSVLVLQQADPDILARIKEESGESVSALIASLSEDLIRRDSDLLSALSTEGGEKVSLGRNQAAELDLSIGTISFDFPKYSSQFIRNERPLIKAYMLDLCRSGYSRLIPDDDVLNRK